MTLPKSDLVILVAKRRESALFLDVLRDWSAQGLIVDLLLVDADAPGDSEGSACLAVEHGNVAAAALQANLARRASTANVHVVCLSQVDEAFSTVGPIQGGAVCREVRDALPSVDLTWVHAISVVKPATWPQIEPELLGWYGCHNVVLVPENSRAPHAGVETVTASPISPVRLTQQAAALCSALGLWTVERRTPFGGAPPSGGRQLVALRTFTRHLDADAVTSRLLARVIDVQREYPVPTLQGRPTRRFDDEPRAAEDMAKRLLNKHETRVLARPRPQTAQSPQTRIRLTALTRMFLRFFWMALRRAPQDFVHSVMHRASAKIAVAAQSAFLGRDGAAYVVTVNGIRGIKENGELATFEEYDGALEALISHIRDEDVPGPPEQHDYAEFWKDFVSGALTLLDAGARSEELRAKQVGTSEGVITDPRHVAYRPSDVFAVAPEVRAVAKIERVSPYDVDAGRRAHDLLGEKAREQPERAAPLMLAQNQLREWFEVRRQSYVGKVGERLADELATVREEVRGYVAALQSLRERTDVPPQLASLQSSLAKVLIVHAAVFGVLVVMTVAAAASDALRWRYASLILLLLVLAWLVSATAIFTQRQQALFRLRHRMESDSDQAAVQKAQLAEALEDLRRLQRLYRQYTDWGRALGSFVEAPWGHSAVADEAEILVGEGYPYNHRFGVAMPDEAVIDDVVNRLRPQVYPVGWLSKAWAAFRTDLPTMGADRHWLEEDADLIFSDRAVSQTSVLTQWSHAVAERIWTGGAAEVRPDIDEALSHGRQLQDRLLSRVRSQDGGGASKVESYQDFVRGLQEVTTGPVDGRRFSPAIFSDVPHSSSPWNVSTVVSNHAGQAIPSTLVVTEISQSFVAEDLRFSNRTPTGTVPPKDSTPSPQNAPQV